MWKQLYKRIYTKNIFKNIHIRRSHSALAIKEAIDYDEYTNNYEIEILHKNIDQLHLASSANILCPICFGNGYIPCPSCKVGCRDCHNTSQINCPLCNRTKY